MRQSCSPGENTQAFIILIQDFFTSQNPISNELLKRDVLLEKVSQLKQKIRDLQQKVTSEKSGIKSLLQHKVFNHHLRLERLLV